MAGFLINLWLHVEVGRSVDPAGHHVLIFAALFDMPAALPIPEVVPVTTETSPSQPASGPR